MLDQLQSTRDPDLGPRRIPRWLLLLLGVVGAGTALGLGVHDLFQSNDAPAAAVHPSPRPAPHPGPAPTESCAEIGAGEALTGHEPDWPRIDAPVRAGPAGESVLAWSVTPMIRVDLGTGAISRPVACTGELDNVSPVPVSWARVMNVADRGEQRVWMVDGTGHLQQLAGDAYAVAGVNDTLLVVSRTASGQQVARYNGPRKPMSVRALADQYLLVGETYQGLIVRKDAGVPSEWFPKTLLVVDPRDGRVLRDLGTEGDDRPVIDGNRLAWIEGAPCPERCELRVTDVASGGTTRLTIPGTTDPASILKAFSPDGVTIALSYADIASRDLPRAGQVLLASVPERTVTPIRGMSTTGNGHPLGIAWSGDGRWLVISETNIYFSRLGVWSTASRSLRGMPWVIMPTVGLDALSVTDGDVSAWR